MQLYMPWQISRGRLLYGDIAWKQGPLSQHLNAALFRIFGVSLTTLIWANLLLVAVLAALLAAFFARCCGRLAGLAAGSVFLSVFAFGQYAWVGNWNYMTPYAHEATHGVALAAASAFCLAEAAREPRTVWFGLGGLLMGLALLTKLEFALASAAAAAVGLVLMPAAGLVPARRALGGLGWFLTAAAVPLIAALLLLWINRPFDQALAALTEHWRLVLAGGGQQLSFYREQMGLEDASGNLLFMARLFAQTCLVLLVAAGADLASRRLLRQRGVMCLAAAGCTAVALWLLPVPWRSIGRILTPTTILVLLSSAGAAICLRRDRASASRAVALAIWAALALAVLGKVLLHPTIRVYGFVHAMPASTLLGACLLDAVPAALRRVRANGDVFCSIMAVLLAAGVFSHLRWSAEHYSRKTWALGEGGDAILTYPPETDPRGAALALLQKELSSRLAPGKTFLMMPEGILVNYLMRRENGCRWMAFTPYDVVSAGGETAMVEDLRSARPDLIVLVHRPMDEYRLPLFGSPGNGAELMRWVNESYRTVKTIGATPNTGPAFGIVILERTEQPAVAGR